ncbi:serine hydrolase FSH [Hypoxylon crocopeplum]|nr:serine hydrolase FSH [Hypoxylon crocopeplum]
MKFLCLHGNGTNCNIMKIQTAPLRHDLEDGHEYEFVEATLQAQMSEGVEALSSADDAFYTFYDPKDLSTLQRSISQLDDYVRTEGPFDVVMGFSGGAILAAMYMVEVQRWGGTVPFKCGIFLSSGPSKVERDHLGLDECYDTICVPTAHIWGANDPKGAQDLSQMCQAAVRHMHTHDGGHELPRKAYLTDAVHIIRRTIDLANH